jgi:hypothetical protein
MRGIFVAKNPQSIKRLAPYLNEFNIKGHYMPIERHKEIRRRRQRKHRLKKLKAKLTQTKDLKEQEKMIDLIRRREPYFQPPK